MKIDEPTGKTRNRRTDQAGFTMIEVVFSAAIAALVLAGMFEGYNAVGQRAQKSACNLAATSMAMSQLEQVVGANWDPSYGDDTLLGMGSTNTANLCLPSAGGNGIICTNWVTVTPFTSLPPYYALIQAQCIWTFPMTGVTYTNTVAVLRAPNE